MSIYNMLFGCNPDKDVILALVGLRESDVERFRNVWLNAEKKIVEVHTRTGGGNRAGYPQEILHSNPNFLTTYDDSGDCTYANFVFRVPTEIEDDLKGLVEPVKHGISANLISHLMKTLNREQTDGDKRLQIYNRQMNVVKNLARQGMVTIWNGHTIVPLCDDGMNTLLREAEKNNGDFIAYWYIMPAKIEVRQNASKWSFDKDKPDTKIDKWRVVVCQPNGKWEIDQEWWQRWKTKYAEKYPMSIKKIEEKIN